MRDVKLVAKIHECNGIDKKDETVTIEV